MGYVMKDVQEPSKPTHREEIAGPGVAVGELFAESESVSQLAHVHGKGRGLYVHVPFCSSKCTYCDFASTVGKEDEIDRYLEALFLELETLSHAAEGERFTSVFVGGGTPTVLGPERLKRLNEAIQAGFGLADDVEWTCEANPESAARETLRAARASGVNRLSIGAQSFSAETLRLLGRVHDAERTRAAVQNARDVGFERLNLDLINGVPGQSPQEWQQTLESALELEPEHLSVYGLILEGGTPLERAVQTGHIRELDEKRSLEMDALTVERLNCAGFTRYEISNWCREGGPCRHNQLYWLQVPWLGAGVAAHTFWHGRRYRHSRRVEAYVQQWLANGRVRGMMVDLHDLESIDESREAEDSMIFGLRLTDGLDTEAFQRRYGYRPQERWMREIEQAIERGWLRVGGSRLCIPADAIAISNELLGLFVETPIERKRKTK